MLPWSSDATLHTVTGFINLRAREHQFDLEDTLYLKVEAYPGHLGLCHLSCTLAIKAHPCFKFCRAPLVRANCSPFLNVFPAACPLGRTLLLFSALQPQELGQPGPDRPYSHPELSLLLFLSPSLNKVVENRAQLICNVISAGSWHSARHSIVTQHINARMFISEKSGRPKICYLWFAHLKIINTLWMLTTSEFSQKRMDRWFLWGSQDVATLGWTPTHSKLELRGDQPRWEKNKHSWGWPGLWLP